MADRVPDAAFQPPNPRVFIGSSVEGLRAAELLALCLEYDTEPVVWKDAFRLTRGTLESLVEIASRVDFAVLVLTADDLVLKRNQADAGPRDNVIFELGLFMGTLGRDRTFFMYNRDDPPNLPSDLVSVQAATWTSRADGDLRAAIAAPCAEIKEAIRRA
jgi:predicted nucleotide-binding protein